MKETVLNDGELIYIFNALILHLDFKLKHNDNKRNL